MWFAYCLTIGFLTAYLVGRTVPSETVFLPPPEVVKERDDDDPSPLPAEPPKIWGATDAILQ